MAGYQGRDFTRQGYERNNHTRAPGGRLNRTRQMSTKYTRMY